MSTDAFLVALRPSEYGSVHCEDFTVYMDRVKDFLPNFPECVVRQWLYEHYADAVKEYGWLGLSDLRFDHATWSAHEVLERVRSFAGSPVIETNATQLTECGSFSRLSCYMIDKGTWPVPIIVCDNRLGLTDPQEKMLGQPYHLLEGHHRLGYLRALVEDQRWEAAGTQELWIATPDAGVVSRQHVGN